MIYSNKKYLSGLLKLQLTAGILLLLAMAATIYFEKFQAVLVEGVLLVLLLILMRVLNFNFVRIQVDERKITIRYYALFTSDRQYEAIEFPVSSLRKATVRKYLLGLKWDLVLSVRLKHGVANYPPICLSAIPSDKRKKIIEFFDQIASGSPHPGEGSLL